MESFNALVNIKKPLDIEHEKKMAVAIAKELLDTENATYKTVYEMLESKRAVLDCQARVLEMACWNVKDFAFHQCADESPKLAPHTS
jgi:hypothetical protein